MESEFDLNLLRVFTAIYEAQSITLAAKRLELSQPTISGALAKLREVFGDDLFVKTAHGMEPTPRAKDLISTVRDVLSRVEHKILTRSVFSPATFLGTITFACSEVAENFLLPIVCAHLYEAAPGIVIQSVQRNIAEILDQMESGAIDLVIGYYPELRRANLYQQKLFSAEFVCLLRADHQIHGERISLGEYAKLNHVSLGVRPRTNDLLGDYLRRKKIKRNVVLSVSHVLTFAQIIERMDLAVTVVSGLGEYLAKMNPKLQAVKVPEDFPAVPIFQYWHRRSHRDPQNKWLRGLVKVALKTSPII